MTSHCALAAVAAAPNLLPNVGDAKSGDSTELLFSASLVPIEAGRDGSMVASTVAVLHRGGDELVIFLILK